MAALVADRVGDLGMLGVVRHFEGHDLSVANVALGPFMLGALDDDRDGLLRLVSRHGFFLLFAVGALGQRGCGCRLCGRARLGVAEDLGCGRGRSLARNFGLLRHSPLPSRLDDMPDSSYKRLRFRR